MQKITRPVIRLTKITDLRFNGEHPNGINIGHRVFGVEFDGPPKVGQRYILLRSRSMWDTWATSDIVKIEGDLITTENSVYERIVT